MSMEVLEALACIAEIDRKSDNLFSPMDRPIDLL